MGIRAAERATRALRDAGVVARAPLYNTFRELGWPRIRPLTMSFVVTDRCNSLCKTCQIGARYLADPAVADGELTLDEYRHLFASMGGLEWVTLSGGEPFMRRDFPEIAVALARATRPRAINVPTNGTFLHATLRGVEHMLAEFGDTQLILNFSVDAIGRAHDSLRGFDGNYARLVDVVGRLRELDAPGLTIGCNTVISRFNAAAVPETIDHVLEAIRPDSYVVEPAQIRPEYYNDEADPEGPSDEVRRALEHALERSAAHPRSGLAAVVKAFRIRYYRDALSRLRRPLAHRCFSAFATCAVMPKGEVWSNTQRAEPMGNVRAFDLDFGALWRSEEAARVREVVRAAPCRCETSNVSYPNALLSPRELAKVGWYAWRHR